MFQFVSMILSIIFLALATTGVPSNPRFQFFPAGVLFGILALGYPILHTYIH